MTASPEQKVYGYVTQKMQIFTEEWQGTQRVFSSIQSSTPLPAFSFIALHNATVVEQEGFNGSTN